MTIRHSISVCGFDPSMRNWGIAIGEYNVASSDIVINNLDLIQPVLPTGKQTRQNSLDIETSFQLFTGAYEACKSSQFIFAEIPAGSQSSRAMCAYGICAGVIGSLKASNLPIVEVTPIEVKMASVRSKTATKQEMIAWATEQHPEAPWPMHGNKITAAKAEHMADAIAAIYAGIKTPVFLNLINVIKKHEN